MNLSEWITLSKQKQDEQKQDELTKERLSKEEASIKDALFDMGITDFEIEGRMNNFEIVGRLISSGELWLCAEIDDTTVTGFSLKGVCHVCGDTCWSDKLTNSDEITQAYFKFVSSPRHKMSACEDFIKKIEADQ